MHDRSIQRPVWLGPHACRASMPQQTCALDSQQMECTRHIKTASVCGVHAPNYNARYNYTWPLATCRLLTVSLVTSQCVTMHWQAKGLQPEKFEYAHIMGSHVVSTHPLSSTEHPLLPSPHTKSCKDPCTSSAQVQFIAMSSLCMQKTTGITRPGNYRAMHICFVLRMRSWIIDAFATTCYRAQHQQEECNGDCTEEGRFRLGALQAREALYEHGHSTLPYSRLLRHVNYALNVI